VSKQITITHYGPVPGPKNSLFTSLVDFADGDIGAEFTYRDDLENPNHWNEELVHKYMHKSNLWSTHPAVPKDLQEFHRIQTKIYHYALASIQADKLKLGKKLDMPLTPHPDVEMNLPALRSAPAVEI